MDCQDCTWYAVCGLRKQKEEALTIGEKIEYFCKDWEDNSKK
jgi:hypothetical protein